MTPIFPNEYNLLVPRTLTYSERMSLVDREE